MLSFSLLNNIFSELLNKGVKPLMAQRSFLTGPYNQTSNPGLQRFCPYTEDDDDEQISLPAFPLQQSTVKDKGSKSQRYISGLLNKFSMILCMYVYYSYLKLKYLKHFLGVCRILYLSVRHHSLYSL